MVVERISGGSSVIDVLDRVLDKGIVIDAWARISLVGIDLMTVEARAVVASNDTYSADRDRDAVELKGPIVRPQTGTEGVIERQITRRARRTVARRA